MNINDNDTKVFINNTRYIQNICLSSLIYITPYIEQRDIRKDRVKIILKKYKDDLEKYGFLKFENSLIIIECENLGNFLRNKLGKTVNKAIVDGQHRLEALKLLYHENSKIGRIRIVIDVHIVKSIEEADIIQYNLFEQESVSNLDKISKCKYGINYDFKTEYENCFIDNFISEYGSGKYKKYIRDESDKMKKPRRTHFLKNILYDEISNSKNIEKWKIKHINHTDIYTKLNNIINNKINEYKLLKDNKDKCTYLRLNNSDKLKQLKKFEENFSICKIVIISFIFFNRYNLLLTELEKEFDIYSDDDTSDDDISDEDITDDEVYYD